MTTPTPTPESHWYHVTPDRFFIGLLVVQVFLFLSERFKWFPFNERKGWTVLIAMCVVIVAVVVMLLWGLVCLCIRRRFRFGVGSLLVFLVAVSIPFGWFAWEMEKARRQREAVERITRAGGTVYYDYQLFCVCHDYWHTPVFSPTPTWLYKLLGRDFFSEAIGVSFFDASFGDNEARRLQKLTNIEFLGLAGTQITDDGLEHLREFKKLTLLNVTRTQVSKTGVNRLQQALPNCRIVHRYGYTTFRYSQDDNRFMQVTSEG